MSWVHIDPSAPVTFPPAERLVLFGQPGMVYGVGLRLPDDDGPGSSWYGLGDPVDPAAEDLVAAGLLYWYPLPAAPPGP